MAKPIKDTPVLTGEVAKKFNKTIKDNETKKVSQEDFKRAMEVFKRYTIVA